MPLIVAGPDLPRGVTCGTPVNLIDFAPTFLAAFKLSDPSLPGRSLFDIAREPSDPERVAFSEYHAVGAPSAAFMLRKGRWKYHEYVGFNAELFDLESDPEEAINRSDDPFCASIASNLRAEMQRIVDPEAADRQAKADQRLLVERFGGRDAAYRIGTEGATPAPTA